LNIAEPRKNKENQQKSKKLQKKYCGTKKAKKQEKQ